MMTSTQIRQSFLDFFKSKQHTIVPSSSLMPDSPNLLFTNAGMNQFVPIFLGQKQGLGGYPTTPSTYSKVAGISTESSGYYSPSAHRAADTQKCIRAGGKHNDLDDVGLDTYHHTFFEMLGNWSFGDYFKKEAIDWAWELVVGTWKFTPTRLYATVYSPDKSKNDPSEFDQEAWNYWAEKFRSVGLDPAVHIVNGNKKDNFWMMGETGPCGPCSELHVDLTPAGDTHGQLVNKGDARCIEIWNLVFIQFNANPDGTFSPLPAKHVDTGMGFERVTSIIQGTKGLTDFHNAKISNYETDIFRPIFDVLEKMSGKTYGSTLPASQNGSNQPEIGPHSSSVSTHGTSVSAHGTPVGTHGTSVGDHETSVGDHGTPVDAHGRPVGGHGTSVGGHGTSVGGHGIPVDTHETSGDTHKSLEYDQIAIDIAFRVIADHIRTLSFAIADGIQPGNNDRNYVLRRILRRAVRYGRTLGFREPFFYKLVDVLADTMGDVFPEIRARKQHVQETIQREEEAFNKTLDKGIALFNEEVAKLECGQGGQSGLGGTGYQPVPAGNLPAGAPGATYSKRNLPHFEKPWAIYVVNFQTYGGRKLSPAARDVVFDCVLKWRDSRYCLVAACVMPDHVHLIIQPGIKGQDPQGEPIFWPLSDILHSIKSFSAKEINKLENTAGTLWQEERYDRYLRSDADLQEKFGYVCGNPWAAGIVDEHTPYRWLWTQNIEAAQPYSPPATLPYAPAAGQVARQNRPVACSTQTNSTPPKASAAAPGGTGYQPVAVGNLPTASSQISGAFAFKLYDEQGFPLDLTELMARERGLTVDTAGFEKLMEEQRARARAAQKKEVISLSQIETTTPTRFVGYEALAVPAKVLEVVSLKDKTAVILDTSACYAEMGGQVGDTGELSGGGNLWRISNTQKSGNTWLHFLEVEQASGLSASASRRSADGETPSATAETAVPPIGSTISLSVDKSRRDAIQRHHTVTHLLHWALHEVASKEASQKGSFVGPDKLTFDFNSAPLTPAQVAEIEKKVNEKILENAPVSWTEVAHADVKHRKDVMQFFGDKYGDTVRVVQIGGGAGKLNGYSMELCGGTHTRATGEIGLFRIVSEAAVAAGVRRIEAVAGLTAYDLANEQLHLIKSIAGKINSPVHEIEKKIEALLAHQKELEKSVKAAQQREASNAASELLERVHAVNGTPAIIHNVGGVDGDFLQAVMDALKSQFAGVVVLGGAANGAVTLIASVSADFTGKVQAGKIIQAIAPIVGGKGGGKPDHARGGGKDATRLDEALAKARSLL